MGISSYVRNRYMICFSIRKVLFSLEKAHINNPFYISQSDLCQREKNDIQWEKKIVGKSYWKLMDPEVYYLEWRN